jgi:hypothetical protein
MKARVISYTLANVQAIEDLLNGWLDEVGEVSIDRCIPLGNAGPDRDCGALVILYREPGDEAPVKAVTTEALCRQCKKRPAIKGMKMCGKCREYQREYRERQKEEKKKSRYP